MLLTALFNSEVKMKVKNLEIVDDAGATVLTLDGDVVGGIKDGSNRLFLAQKEITWQLLAASVDSFVWRCRNGVWQLEYADSNITVSGGASAAVQIVHCAGGVAIASGTAQLTAALDLEETAPNKQTGVLIATPTKFYPGDVLGLDFSGTLTGLVGVLTMGLKRVE